MKKAMRKLERDEAINDVHGTMTAKTRAKLARDEEFLCDHSR
jgi:hypothetical protein